jgi:hypothetical protein
MANQPPVAEAPKEIVPPKGFTPKVDCTLEMRQLGWAHFAGKGLQSEAEAILSEVSAHGR